MDQQTVPKNNGAENLICKLYVRNINKSTNSRSLEEYFQKFGTLTDVSLIMEPSGGLNRGYAFVTFENDKSVDDCLLCTSHKVDDRELDVRRVMPKTIKDPLLQNKTNRIFIGGLPQGVTEKVISDHFNSKYSNLGEVEEVIIKKDRQSNRPRGFCFVAFKSHHVVDKILLSEPFPTIGNKRCEVRKADAAVPITGAPPATLQMMSQMSCSHRQNGHASGRSGSYQGGMGSNGGGGRYPSSRQGMRPDVSAYMHHHPAAPHPYTNSAHGMDDMGMGGFGGYYSPYSVAQHSHQYQSNSMNPSHPQYDSVPSSSNDRHYSQPGSYGASSVPPPSHGYENHSSINQRHPMYSGSGTVQQHSSSSLPQDYSYHQSSIYGKASAAIPQSQVPSNAQSVGNQSSAASQLAYGSGSGQSVAGAASGAQPVVSAYGSSYSHSGTGGSIGQTVSYPTRSYRPSTAAVGGQQAQSSNQNIGVANPALPHRPY